MSEKRIRIFFIAIFFVMILVPLFTTNLKKGAISEAENRILAPFPQIYSEHGSLNPNWNNDFETWINDNIGLRAEMVIQNAKMQYYLFNVLANNSDMILGPHGEFDYATEEILLSYQHLDLKTNEALDKIADGFQYVNDYLNERGIQLYYFQCWDKQSIYPEHFPASVVQYGNISKTDQIVETLTTRTDVKVISPKEKLIAGKDTHETYSKWGDPTHWTQRGAYIGYLSLMQEINKNNNDKYNVLNEKDYNISWIDMGFTLFGGIHEECMLENFEISEPHAQLTQDKLVFLAEDQRHKFYTNESVYNNTRVLILGDSYFESFIIDDLAESFHELIIIWGDHAGDFENLIKEYAPDIVIIENAERCDRSDGYAAIALMIKNAHANTTE